jgi:hypothetical protein
MRIWALFFLMIAPLNAEKIIHCITNFQIDDAWYTKMIQERGYDGRVVSVDINQYGKDIPIKKGRWQKFLREMGITSLFKVHVDENVDKIVFFNLPHTVCKSVDLSRFPKDKMVLFMWEPKTVICRMYEERYLKSFSKILTWDDDLVDNQKYYKFNYPVLMDMITAVVPFEEKKFCTLISSKKTGYGKHELYSEREKAISYFESVDEKGFEFFGRWWDGAIHPRYRGEINDKLAVLKDYRFCVCYENTHIVKGYITEKIFDCFAVGVVPIYWGASNVDSYIPKGCYIDRREFASLEDLHKFLKTINKEQYEGYLTEIRNFLQSEKAQQFSQKALADAFFLAVQ